MKYCLIRKVPFKLPGTQRITWGYVLSEREGLAFLLVPASTRKQPHMLTVAQENVLERLFESASGNFNLGTDEILELGNRLRFLSTALCDEEFMAVLNDIDEPDRR